MDDMSTSTGMSMSVHGGAGLGWAGLGWRGSDRVFFFPGEGDGGMVGCGVWCV